MSALIRTPAPRIRISAILALLSVSPWGGPSVLAQGTLHTWMGWAGSELGRSVAAVGDVNGDGFDDVIYGMPESGNTAGWKYAGRAYVRSGFDGATLFWTEGTYLAHRLGYAMCGLGDTNGDGVPDYAIGAPGESWGRVRVHSGATGSQLYLLGGSSGDSGTLIGFGEALANAGDVNNDGVDDLIIGAPGQDFPGKANAGSAYVRSGANGAALWQFNGDSASDNFGKAVGGAGDVNNDGFDDVIVGAPYDDNGGNNTGSARVFSGVDGSVLHTFNGSYASAVLGWSVGAAGDVDHDGNADLLVSSHGVGNPALQPGYARIYSGLSGAVLHQFAGSAAGHQFGFSVANAGDMDGDGQDDLLIGAPYAGGANKGTVTAYSGATFSPLFSVVGDVANNYFGLNGLSGAGDVNGDGRADFILGTIYGKSGATNVGLARVYSGACGAITSYGAGCPGSGGFAPGLALSGCAAAGCAITVDVTGGLGGSPALLAIGTSAINAPVGGGCSSYVSPFLLMLPITLAGSGAGNGAVGFAGKLPMGVAGLTLTLQTFILDPGAVIGYTATNGVQLDVQ